MKILCICRGGNTRSVALKMILNKVGHDAIALGAERNSEETLNFLGDKWADRVIVLHPSLMKYIPKYLLNKTLLLDVGDDIWGSPFHPDLQRKLVELLNENRRFLIDEKPIQWHEVAVDLKRYKEKVKFRNVRYDQSLL